MKDPKERAPKSLGQRIDELLEEIMGGLGRLFAPPPVLVPVPVRGRPRPRR